MLKVDLAKKMLVMLFASCFTPSILITPSMSQSMESVLKRSLELAIYIPPPTRKTNNKAGRPKRSKVGGERSPWSSLGLLALVPADNGTGEYQFLTTRERPVLWISNPKTCPASTPCQLKLELLSLSTLKTVFEQNQPWNSTQGLVALTIPEDQPGLESGERYRWRITFMDSLENNLDRTSVNMTRVSESERLKGVLEKATTPEDRYEAYGAEHIWFESLDGVLHSYQDNDVSPSIMEDWQDLQNTMMMNCTSSDSSQKVSSLRCTLNPDS